MTIPTVAWNESNPAGTASAGQGDDRIREFKTQVREVVGVDHQFNSSGSDADNGKHTVLHILDNTSDPTVDTGAVELYSKDDADGNLELYSKDAAGNVLQITKAGALNTSPVSYSTGTVTVTNGSTTVSGSGTNWTSAMVGGNFKGPDGEFYLISAVPAVTTLTLGRVYDGTTTSGASYTLYYDTNPAYVPKGGGTINGDLSIGGALTLAGSVVSAGAKNISILTGVATHGDTLPLPSGFTEGECSILIAPAGPITSPTSGYSIINLNFSVTSLVVTAQVTMLHYTGGAGEVKSCPVNYMVIGVH